MPKENPYKWMIDRPGMAGGSVPDERELYRYYTSDEYQKKCRENQRHISWNSGFVAGRKNIRRLKLLSKKFAAEDAEYDIYANLADELGY